MTIEPCLLYAIRFASSNPTIRVNTGSAQTLTLGVTAGVDYFMSGDDAADDLVKKLEDCLNTNSDGKVFTVTINERNVLTIAVSGASSVLWADALTTVDETLFGFPSNVGPGTSFTAPDQTKGVWIPGTSARPVGFRTDTRTEPVTVGAMMETVDGQSRVYDLTSTRGERVVTFHLIDRAKILTEYVAADEPFGALEHSWTNGFCRGRTVRVYDDKSDRTTYETFRVAGRGRPWREMGVSFIQRYEVELRLREA